MIWVCPQCGYKTLVHHDDCSHCGSRRPAPAPKPKPASAVAINWHSLLPMMTVKPMRILSSVEWLLYHD